MSYMLPLPNYLPLIPKPNVLTEEQLMQAVRQDIPPTLKYVSYGNYSPYVVKSMYMGMWTIKQSKDNVSKFVD